MQEIRVFLGDVCIRRTAGSTVVTCRRLTLEVPSSCVLVPLIGNQLVELPAASQSEFQQHSVDQTVDIPVQGGDGRRGELQGQNATTTPREGLQGFLSGQGSAASSSVHRSSAAALNTAEGPFDGVFCHFPPA